MRHLLIFAFDLIITCLQAQSPINTSLQFRNIGPANQGGRIVDIEARADAFDHVYAASASGGVWKSVNAGTTWQPIFDDYETASIGDIALDPKDANTLWVGTGEANNRNSVSWGNGVYLTRDGGNTFEHKGLASTHQIARVLVHPERSDEVCVCAIGHLWGYSGERGLFRTTDGGDTWDKLTNGLPSDGKTGCTDLVQDPQDPNILYAAFYHRLRQPWHFESGGKQGGIFKSTDGGKSWRKLENGLPSPTGRIGLAIYQKDPNILMAIVEAERSDTLSVLGSGVYRSEDGGASWSYVNTYNNRPFYYSQIRINPHDDQRVYVLTTSFMVSEDGGKTLTNGSKDQEVHGDFHGMWLDPTDPDRYYLGADKGLSMTHDHGQTFRLIDNLPIGQYYRINYDMQTPYYVYGGLQDNGSYATASFSRDGRGILSDANWKMHWGDGQDAAFNPHDHTDAYSSMENEAFFKYNPETRQISRITPTYATTINHQEYFASSDDMASDLRYNWSAPLMMSPQDPSKIYIASNHVFRSTDRGQTWEIISPDLSTNDPRKRKAGLSGGITPDNTGAETHCSIHSLSLSPISEDIIWVGTDDGKVQVTKDGGRGWQNVEDNIPEVPKDLWVGRVEASHHHPGRAYVVFDGHRSDHFQPWVFVSDDYGQSWRKIVSGIKSNEVTRVIREDHRNPNLLFVGTETGVWYTLDRGVSWKRMGYGLPTVSVYDIKIHPRDNDLIIGTHGRSIWIMDDISPLQEWNDIQEGQGLHLFEQEETTLWHNLSRGGQRGHFWWSGANPPNIENTSTTPRAGYRVKVPITFYADGTKDSVDIKIIDKKNDRERHWRVPAQNGINRVYWNREFDALPYTEEERSEITAILTEILDQTESRRTKSIIARFFATDDPHRRRLTIMPLKNGYMSYPIPDLYGMPVAGPGTYRLEISDGTNRESTSITLQPDVIE